MTISLLALLQKGAKALEWWDNILLVPFIRQDHWSEHFAWTPKLLIDQTYAEGYVMRRRLRDGTYQYREQTIEESDEGVATRTW